MALFDQSAAVVPCILMHQWPFATCKYNYLLSHNFAGINIFKLTTSSRSVWELVWVLYCHLLLLNYHCSYNNYYVITCSYNNYYYAFVYTSVCTWCHNYVDHKHLLTLTNLSQINIAVFTEWVFSSHKEYYFILSISS